MLANKPLLPQNDTSYFAVVERKRRESGHWNFEENRTQPMEHTGRQGTKKL